MTTFIVVAEGDRGAEIARMAREHAAFEPESRHVVTVSDAARPADVAAIMVNRDGVVCAWLDERQSMSEAWIEDAFVRGKR